MRDLQLKHRKKGGGEKKTDMRDKLHYAVEDIEIIAEYGKEKV